MWEICPLKIPVKLIEIDFLKLVIIPLNQILIDNTQQHGLFSPFCLGQYQEVLLHEAHPGPRRRYRSEVCRGTQQKALCFSGIAIMVFLAVRTAG